MKAAFSNNMFPGATAAEKKEQQKLLGLDLKNRCHAIFKQLFMQHNGDIAAIAARIIIII